MAPENFKLNQIVLDIDWLIRIMNKVIFIKNKFDLRF